MFATTIAGSLPKPSWLAQPNLLWAPWRLEGADLDGAKLDATLLAVKLQETFGWSTAPRVAGGKVPVVLHLLSPAGRPVAVTVGLPAGAVLRASGAPWLFK